MVENIYLCKECRNLLKATIADDAAPKTAPNCPVCGSSQMSEIPCWVPAGSDLGSDTYTWEYECQECRNRFRMPIPSSPSQEKDIKCPSCGATHIHRLTPMGGEPLHCG
jgi:DNA-directed RNA polymerase subunit RPC12/RpoP